MTNYREILRLDDLGLNKTQIAEACGCSRTTVIQTLRLAKEKRLQYPLPESISDRQLADLLFPSAVGKPVFRMPDYEYVYRELQKNGVTLNLLCLEYCDACRSAGETPYQSTQFNKHYNDFLMKKNATMHLNHKDWCFVRCICRSFKTPRPAKLNSTAAENEHLRRES